MMVAASSERNRVRWLTLCAASWGFAIGISLLPYWDRPAPAGQLPGYMTMLGRDAHASFRFMAGIVLMTFVVALAMRPVVRILASDETRAWARNASAVAMIAALWLVIISRDLAWTTVPQVIAIGVLVALRRTRVAFSRRDAILVPVCAAVFLAIMDMSALSVDRAMIVAVGIVVAIRIGLVFLRQDRALPASLAFAIAPLALVSQTGYFARDQRYSPWLPLAIAILTPFVLRLLVRDSPQTRRRIHALIAFVIYPVAAFSYMSATSLVTAEGKRRINFFEDSQHVVAAGEMLRGEKPYRDIVPPHGFIEDSLLDYVALELGPNTLGNIQKVRGVLGGGNAIMNYALAAAATGSPHAGILALFLGAALGSAGGTLRVLPASIALLFAVAGVRRRRGWMLVVSGALCVIAVLTSLDFGTYAIVSLVFAVAVFGETRSDKLAALRSAAIGAGAAATIAAVGMLLGGFFIDCVRVTLFEIAPLGSVYALPPFHAPPGFHRFGYVPEALVAIFDRTTFLYVVWILNLLAFMTAIAIGVRGTPRRRAALHALMVISAFVVICCLSYAERHHQHFQFVVAPLIVAVLLRMRFSRERLVRLAAPVAMILVLMMASPTVHIAITGAVRRSRGPMEPGWTTSSEPRAGGALMRERDVAIVTASRAYLERTVGPDGTFFDFTNRAMLFFLLNRDCPIRQIEPAFYETEALQKEVIARIANNSRVRAALVPKASNDDHTGVDIPNPVRAPLVWKYLQENFQPDYEDENIVFWRRK